MFITFDFANFMSMIYPKIMVMGVNEDLSLRIYTTAWITLIK